MFLPKIQKIDFCQVVPAQIFLWFLYDRYSFVKVHRYVCCFYLIFVFFFAGRTEAALNLFINSNSQELLKEMKPHIKKKLMVTMKSFIDNLFSRVPYDSWIIDWAPSRPSSLIPIARTVYIPTDIVYSRTTLRLRDHRRRQFAALFHSFIIIIILISLVVLCIQTLHDIYSRRTRQEKKKTIVILSILKFYYCLSVMIKKKKYVKTFDLYGEFVKIVWNFSLGIHHQITSSIVSGPFEKYLCSIIIIIEDNGLIIFIVCSFSRNDPKKMNYFLYYLDTST